MADPGDIAHLLRRTEFVARPARIQALTPLSIPDAVDDVLNVGLNGAVTPPSNLFGLDNSYTKLKDTVGWWLNRMAFDAPRPIAERMTLFWHGHFTSEWWKVGCATSMVNQNQLLRTHALGDFRQLAQRVAIDPAMVRYLDNCDNRKGSENQNFARELLELFLLGVGNYTEDDVIAASRAWTGHTVNDSEQYVFRSDWHDPNPKTIFGATVYDGPEVIDQILVHHAEKRLIAARFIARKLWLHLAGPTPSDGLVDELANAFLAANLSIRALVRAILVHPSFYTPEVKQGLVRCPIEFVVATMWHGGLRAGAWDPTWTLGAMGQHLFLPQNVSGWKTNGFWVDTGSWAGRARFARHAMWTLRNQGVFNDMPGLAIPDAVTQATQRFGIDPVSEPTRAALTSYLTAQRTVKWADWWQATNLLTMVLLAPEFHLA